MTPQSYLRLPDRFEHSLEAIVGVALTRRDEALQAIERHTPEYAGALAAMPAEAQLLLFNEGAVVALGMMLDLLKAHLKQEV